MSAASGSDASSNASLNSAAGQQLLHALQEAQGQVNSQAETIAQQAETIAQLQATNAQLQATNAQLQATNAQLQATDTQQVGLAIKVGKELKKHTAVELPVQSVLGRFSKQQVKEWAFSHGCTNVLWNDSMVQYKGKLALVA
ncbi:hypothetical protein VOLCADRAFT_105638 [Volvox carteri f. nagariensis]|uniref:Uncharacterized protein n=1 Tax=Volvox carteri f. nagariensis TaxID=3068 RepID=D8U206_VOLCA|nr:uncharacterized protein VOLCADRAFT_105638 [Volvox carteri f. nagariensis]EFJ46199.1 hypothetical protein VOLCADRAFT_105638 [Volvox carteri f. nagariensis]|eukprot:XP_002952646.1 hypothetical protein VOLCADRAFT_105638 [Volvox carteri f. nagariensis]